VRHHLVPFYGHAHIAYIPNRRLSASQSSRILEFYAKRPQIQERLTEQVADYLWNSLHPLGAMVVIEARHLCVEMRGVKKPGASRYLRDPGVLRGPARSAPSSSDSWKDKRVVDAGIARRAGLELPGWTLEGESWSGAGGFPTFSSAWRRQCESALSAERADHHPELRVAWGLLEVRLTTHKVKKLTDRDLDLASAIQSALQPPQS